MNISGTTAALHPGHLGYGMARRFFEELVGMGLELVVASPGSRSTALILAAATTPGITLDIQHDERVAAFVALGYGRAARKPATLVCTSGSAGAHYLPAVLEGHYSGVPMIMLTADRPGELQGVGSPQTVDQSHFFSGFTRLTRLLPDIDAMQPAEIVSLAGQVWRATSEGRGPAHVNWRFPEPLEPGPLDAAPLDVGRSSGQSTGPQSHPSADELSPQLVTTPVAPDDESALHRALGARRGIIVVGPDDHPPQVRHRILEISHDRGWPVFADIGSGLRTNNPPNSVIPWIEPAFHPGGLADQHAPETILRIGRMPTAKAFSQWLSRHREIPVVLLNSHIEVHDFTRTAGVTIQGSPIEALERIEPGEGRDAGWLDLWEKASFRAESAAAAELPPTSEAGLIVSMLRGVDHAASVHLASSMPIRHADGFAGNLDHNLRVFVNRGTNGIDGTIASTLGESMALDQPAVAVVGDIAFLHDAGGLLAAGRGERNVTLIVIDNDGGGIFSFLPIAADLPGDTFTRLFRTPHGTDIRGLAKAAGGRIHANPGALNTAIRRPGLDVIVLETDPDPAPSFRTAHRAAAAAMLGGPTDLANA